MKLIYLLIFLLTFLSQNAFCQDYSKMSANEKAKVIIYGDLYPYSLLLESGTDTLSVYQSVKGKGIILFFEEGRLMKVASSAYQDTTIFDYDGDKIVRRYDGYDKGKTAYINFPVYRNDSLIAMYDRSFYEGEYHYGQYDYQDGACEKRNQFSGGCLSYNKDSIFVHNKIWVFLKNKIIHKIDRVWEDTQLENLIKIYYIKKDYVYILTENHYTPDNVFYSNRYDFITSEKHELKFKIIKSPKDKPRKKWEEEDY